MNTGNSLVLGGYGVFILAVVIAGNSVKLTDKAKEDGPHFLPWLIAVVLLTLLASNDNTKAAAAPLTFLLIINVLLRNWSTIKQQFSTLLKGA
jgi:hypothetical protein